MNWNLLKLLLSSSLLITACSSSHTREVSMQAELKDLELGVPSETTGYIFVTKPKDYVFSYAREENSKTKFGVAVTSPDQQTSENGLVIPTALIYDCSTGKGTFNLMKIQPANEVQEWVNKEVNEQIMIFCYAHKNVFKHSHW